MDVENAAVFFRLVRLGVVFSKFEKRLSAFKIPNGKFSLEI